MERPTAVTLRKLAASQVACEELQLAVALVEHAYHFTVTWMDEHELDALCVTLAPWLLPLLSHSHSGTHLALVLGDPLRNTVYVSRRVLRLFLTRLRHPAALTPLTSATAAALAQTTTAGAMGPVARLAVAQADALLAVATRMSASLTAGVSGSLSGSLTAGVSSVVSSSLYIVTLPHAVAEAVAQVASGQPCRVLAIPRVDYRSRDGHIDGRDGRDVVFTPERAVSSGPLTWRPLDG